MFSSTVQGFAEACGESDCFISESVATQEANKE